jgi:CDP-diacylglycerol--glycerol-3-phosphate 3-phosphatidyltransferase
MATGSPKRRQTLRQEFTNLPNMLTMGRIALIPPVMLLMVAATPATNFYATVLFGIAAVTDWLDGYLARRRGLESVLGKLLDPMADKLIVLAVLVMAAELGNIPGWFVVLLLSREVAISGLRSIASTEGLTVDVVSAGKWKTALQLCGLVGVILQDGYRVDFLFVAADVDFGAMGFALLAVSMVFSVLSAAIYFRNFLRAVAARQAGGADDPSP